MNTPSLDTNTLTQLLAQKCEVLLQLRQLVGRQFELIDASNLSQLLNLLSEKQRLITTLQKIQQQLDPFRAQQPEQRQWPSEGDRRRCADLADACQRLLAEVVEIDKQSENRLVLRRDEAATQLQNVHFAIQARQAYVEPTGPTKTFVDLSSG
jgi:flagellar biosynthesis/type III secretory pathway chaperone